MLFAAIGAAVFGAYAVLQRGEAPNATRIVVTAETVGRLAAEWQELRGRPPTEDELRGEIDRWARDEILVREAVALGLGEEDTIVRERLVRKMERRAAEAERSVPTDEEIRAYFEAHRDRYGADGWTPPLEQVRGAVELDLEEERRRRAVEEFYRQARRKYSVEVPSSGTAD